MVRFNFQLQIQNRAARRMNFHDRDRFVGMSAENLSLYITIGAKIIAHTTFTVGELILQLHTHQLHSFNCRGINLCNECVSLAVCLSCLYDISEKQLHNNNARGINIQLHAHQLHINNCWGINCVIIPAPMVEGGEPPLTLRRKKSKTSLYFGQLFPCTPGPFSL